MLDVLDRQPLAVRDPAWWLPEMPALSFVAVVALAAVAAAWLRYDATVWADAYAAARRRITIREFLSRGWWCDICSTYWATIPVFVWYGPLLWLAINGGYLIAARHLPTLIDPPPDTTDGPEPAWTSPPPEPDPEPSAGGGFVLPDPPAAGSGGLAHRIPTLSTPTATGDLTGINLDLDVEGDGAEGDR